MGDSLTKPLQKFPRLSRYNLPEKKGYEPNLSNMDCLKFVPPEKTNFRSFEVPQTQQKPERKHHPSNSFIPFWDGENVTRSMAYRDLQIRDKNRSRLEST